VKVLTAFRQEQIITKWKDKHDFTLVSTLRYGKLQSEQCRNGIMQKLAVVLV
jgi:hypothetical protein